MAIELTWHGHGTWTMQIGDQKVLLDPFFDDNPSADISADQAAADFILISHGHFDHVADCASIANRTGAKVVAIFEIAQWLANKHSVADPIGMNIGGAVELEFGTVKMTPAIHSSQLPDGSYGGEPAGFLITAEGKKIYFACDTALFSDMQLISPGGVDVAVVPIGDLFTMGPEESVRAIDFVQARQALPAHYNTWPPIEQDADAWAAQVRDKTSAEAFVLSPGDTHLIS